MVELEDVFICCRACRCLCCHCCSCIWSHHHPGHRLENEKYLKPPNLCLFDHQQPGFIRANINHWLGGSALLSVGYCRITIVGPFLFGKSHLDTGLPTDRQAYHAPGLRVFGAALRHHGVSQELGRQAADFAELPGQQTGDAAVDVPGTRPRRKWIENLKIEMHVMYHNFTSSLPGCLFISCCRVLSSNLYHPIW